MLYNNIPVLSTPITINKNGFFVQDETRIADEVNESLEYWNTEKVEFMVLLKKKMIELKILLKFQKVKIKNFIVTKS